MTILKTAARETGVLQATTVDEEQIIRCASIELLLNSKFAFKVFGFAISKSSLIRKKCILLRSVPTLTKKRSGAI